VKLSLSGFLFEDDYTKQSLPIDQFCHVAKTAGYDGVELRDTQVDLRSSHADRCAVSGIVADAGLSITCLTCRGLPAAGDEREVYFRSYLALCMDLGCTQLKIGGDTEWLHEAAEEAAHCGVTLATNNHIGSALETVGGTRAYIEAIDHPNMRLLFDCMHLMAAGEDYITCIPQLAPLTCNILVHSLRKAQPGEETLIAKNGVRWTQARITESGIQNWRAVFAAFRATGYDGIITVIENGWPEALREAVARESAISIRTNWEEG
jgi:sugar phosphate isomerase/epimerase